MCTKYIKIESMQRMEKKKMEIEHHRDTNQSPSPKLKHLDLINKISIRFLPTPKEKLIKRGKSMLDRYHVEKLEFIYKSISP